MYSHARMQLVRDGMNVWGIYWPLTKTHILRPDIFLSVKETKFYMQMGYCILGASVFSLLYCPLGAPQAWC